MTRYGTRVRQRLVRPCGHIVAMQLDCEGGHDTLLTDELTKKVQSEDCPLCRQVARETPEAPSLAASTPKPGLLYTATVRRHCGHRFDMEIRFQDHVYDLDLIDELAAQGRAQPCPHCQHAEAQR